MRRTFRVSVCPFRVQFGSMFISSSSSSCTAFAFFENQCCSRIITELWLTCTIEILANSVRFRIRGFRATCFRNNVCHALTKSWPPHEVLLLSYKLKLEHKAAPADLQMSFKFSNEGDRGLAWSYISLYIWSRHGNQIQKEKTKVSQALRFCYTTKHYY